MASAYEELQKALTTAKKEAGRLQSKTIKQLINKLTTTYMKDIGKLKSKKVPPSRQFLEIVAIEADGVSQQIDTILNTASAMSTENKERKEQAIVAAFAALKGIAGSVDQSIRSVQMEAEHSAQLAAADAARQEIAAARQQTTQQQAPPAAKQASSINSPASSKIVNKPNVPSINTPTTASTQNIHAGNRIDEFLGMVSLAGLGGFSIASAALQFFSSVIATVPAISHAIEEYIKAGNLEKDRPYLAADAPAARKIMKTLLHKINYIKGTIAAEQESFIIDVVTRGSSLKEALHIFKL